MNKYSDYFKVKVYVNLYAFTRVNVYVVKTFFEKRHVGEWKDACRWINSKTEFHKFIYSPQHHTKMLTWSDTVPDKTEFVILGWDRISLSIQDGSPSQKLCEFQVNRKLRYTKIENGMDGNDVHATPCCQDRISFLNSTLVATPDNGLKKQAYCLYNPVHCLVIKLCKW